jgi:hypothetical protein
MDVKIKDRKTDIEYLRLSLVLSGVQIDYATTDLINDLFSAVKKKKGKFSISDAIEIRAAHEAKYRDYFKQQSESETENKINQ